MFKQHVRQGINGFLELVFPGRCLLCGSALDSCSEPFYPVCCNCLKRLPEPTGRRCLICSRALISEHDTCTSCRQRSYHFNSNHSLFEYRDEVKDIIYYYKFRNRGRMSLVIGGLFARVIQANYQSIPVVPVPPRPGSKRRRGWDPMERICGLLRRKYGFRIVECLKRTDDMPQKSLDFESRLTNLRGKIRLKRHFSPLGPEILILDDIFTTGATLDECARILCADGAGRVRALTFAVD